MIHILCVIIYDSSLTYFQHAQRFSHTLIPLKLFRFIKPSKNMGKWLYRENFQKKSEKKFAKKSEKKFGKNHRKRHLNDRGKIFERFISEIESAPLFSQHLDTESLFYLVPMKNGELWILWPGTRNGFIKRSYDWATQFGSKWCESWPTVWVMNRKS